MVCWVYEGTVWEDGLDQELDNFFSLTGQIIAILGFWFIQSLSQVLKSTSVAPKQPQNICK